MKHIVCYQYEIGYFDGKHPSVTHFAKSLDDVFKKYVFGRNGYCKAVAGWRIKTFHGEPFRLGTLHN